MGKQGEEVWYTPGEDGLFDDPVGEDEKPPRREGYHLFWGSYSTIEYAPSPQGTIPIALTLTVGIIRDKLTGQCCMAQVNQIQFKQ